MTSPPEITGLLVDWSNGSAEALEKLMPMVERELRRIAANHMRREPAGHTLQTTALVNEAYLRLIDQRQVHWQNRSHFFGVAAQLMRRILVDRARHRKRVKRGGGAAMVSLDQAVLVTRTPAVDLLALDEALTKLAEQDKRKARI